MNSARHPQATPQAADLARQSARQLSGLLAERPNADRARLTLDGHELVIPRQALVLLRDLLAQMALGNAVTVVPIDAELTTQEAANLLNVSRPHLVKILEEGRIPFSRTGSHRRIRCHDVMAYKQRRDAEGAAAPLQAQDHDRDHPMDEQDKVMIGGSLEVPRAALQALAQRHRIRRLALFGSAARGELRPDSDIDLLVEFETDAAPSLGTMVKIQEAFTTLFGGRKVDVATPAILNNPYRRRAIERDMKELYAA